MIIGSPPNSCSTLARDDRIRVPRPAARVIAASEGASCIPSTRSVVLTVIRHLPRLTLLTRRDHPFLVEGASIGDIDSRLEQVHDAIAPIALVLELVMDNRLTGFLIDCLSDGQRFLLVEL